MHNHHTKISKIAKYTETRSILPVIHTTMTGPSTVDII